MNQCDCFHLETEFSVLPSPPPSLNAEQSHSSSGAESSVEVLPPPQRNFMIPQKEINMVPDMAKWKRSQVQKGLCLGMRVEITRTRAKPIDGNQSSPYIWKTSGVASRDYIGFILTLNEGVKGKKLTCEYKVSEIELSDMVCRRFTPEY
uniref:Uncharacterized protein n=1 Tax=Sphaerodactylus townsendi TaxID=933632 RepID=A0ACB8F1I1_9SAUR